MSEKLKEWHFKNINEENSEKNPSSETILEETSILKEK
jgi:hypothetical protein|nr:MAG TPA: hypothetical protein [Caudoviricetes sp.]